MYVSGTFLFVHGLGLKAPGRLRAAGGDLFVRFWKDGGMKTPAYQHKETYIYTVHGCTDTRTKAHMHADTNRFYCLPKACSLSAHKISQNRWGYRYASLDNRACSRSQLKYTRYKSIVRIRLECWLVGVMSPLWQAALQHSNQKRVCSFSPPFPPSLPTPYLFLNIANYEQSTSEPMPFVTQLVQ